MAKLMNDISLIESGVGEDLAVVAGDFAIVESTAMHQRQLILDSKGDFKQNPTIGVGAFGYIDDEGPNDLIRAISVEFARDGMDVASVGLLPSGNIQTDAFYI